MYVCAHTEQPLIAFGVSVRVVSTLYKGVMEAVRKLWTWVLLLANNPILQNRHKSHSRLAGISQALSRRRTNSTHQLICISKVQYVAAVPKTVSQVFQIIFPPRWLDRLSLVLEPRKLHNI